jgi:hypothetical protein
MLAQRRRFMEDLFPFHRAGLLGWLPEAVTGPGWGKPCAQNQGDTYQAKMRLGAGIAA